MIDSFEYTHWSFGPDRTHLRNIGLDYQEGESAALFQMLH